MSATIYPARRYRFTVEAIVPPCRFNNDELRLYIAAQRALLLGGMVAGMAVLPFEPEQGSNIEIEQVNVMEVPRV